MDLKRMMIGVAAGAASALAVSSAAMAAAPSGPVVTNTIDIGTYAAPGKPAYFFNTSGSPFGPSLTAEFGDTISPSNENFADLFSFVLPVNGTGSGSLSTSFTSALNTLTIEDVKITSGSFSKTFTAAEAAAGVNGIPITEGATDVIEVDGYSSPSNTGAVFSGTTTFAASAAPEPAAWALMILGLGFSGAMLRRRQSGALAA